MDSSPSGSSLGPVWRQAAAAAAGGQQYPAGALYVVATPIGNLADLSLRALHVLGLVDAVACEDTRVTAGLLHRFGLSPHLMVVHEHNEQAAAAQVVARLAAGARVAYVSDAGTPGVSDPGARLVAAVRAAGHRVVPLPGASAVATALSIAGDVGGAVHAGAFGFGGFLPPRGRARLERLDAAVREPMTTVLFEAPHRIHELAKDVAERCPARQVTVCRELTKQFEQIHTLACVDLPAWLSADAQRQRGEFVLVLHALPPPVAEEGLPAQTQQWLQALLAELPLKQAVALCAQVSGAPRNAVYQAALAWKASQTGDERGDPADR